MVLRARAVICSRDFKEIMTPRLIRPLLVVEFLIAVQVWLTFWSEVGGQYHLDLMFWPWKFGLTVAVAGLITAITANLFANAGAVTRRALLYGVLLLGVMAVAGAVTYYYHMNEPTDEENDEEQPTVTDLRCPGSGFQSACGIQNKYFAEQGIAETTTARDFV